MKDIVMHEEYNKLAYHHRSGGTCHHLRGGAYFEQLAVMLSRAKVLNISGSCLAHTFAAVLSVVEAAF